jgi:hypothetical protein
LAAAEKRAKDITKLATERAQEVDNQLATLKDANDKAQTQIASLGQTVQKIETQLGGFSAQAETGNKPPGFIYTGPGYKNYGPWGVITSVVGRMVTADGFPWREEFSGLKPGSAEFDQAWRTLGEREPDRFREQQQEFIQSQYFEPAVRELSDSCGLDVRARSNTLQEVIWAMAVSIGGRLIEECQTLRDAGRLDLADPRFDERLSRAIYEAARTAWGPGDRLAVEKNEREMRAALEQLAREQTRRGR